MTTQTTPQDIIAMLENNVAMCVRIFRQYELMHLDKTPPDMIKAERNSECAKLCETSLTLLDAWREEATDVKAADQCPYSKIEGDNYDEC